MRRTLWIGVMAVVGACGEEAGTSRLGHVAFQDRETGHLAVNDVATGERTMDVRLVSGVPQQITLDPTGRFVAWATTPMDGVSFPFVAEVATGELHVVVPSSRDVIQKFTWSVGGWFWWVGTTETGTREIRIGVTDSRQSRAAVVGEGELLASREEPWYVATRCETPAVGDAPCPMEMTLEAFDGESRRLLGRGTGMRLIAVLERMGLVAAYEEIDGAQHLVVRDLSDGRPRDLGVFMSWLEIEGRTFGLAPVSPDETEVLTSDGTDLVAVRLDGSGSRRVAPGVPDRAGFTPLGDVVFEQTVNVAGPGEPIDARHRLLVERDGAIADLAEGLDCFGVATHVSPSGQFATWSCDQKTQVFSIPARAPVVDFPTTFLLGFAGDDAGVVTIENQGVSFWSFDGEHRPVEANPAGSISYVEN